MTYKNKNTKEKIFSKLKRDERTGCLNWTGGKLKSGYGMAHWECKTVLAHRLVWILTYGRIQNELCLLHKCDNPSCCNVDHLFLGTHKDNSEDMMRKFRHRFKSKLSVKDVAKIKNTKKKRGIGNELAKQFGVSKQNISMIRNNHTWKLV